MLNPKPEPSPKSEKQLKHRHGRSLLFKIRLAGGHRSVPGRPGCAMVRASAGRKPAELLPAAWGAAVLPGSPVTAAGCSLVGKSRRQHR